MKRAQIERLVAWAAQECEWQQTGPMEVNYLIDAYMDFRTRDSVTLEVIANLGRIIEPSYNRLVRPPHWRTMNVAVGSSLKVDHNLVGNYMEEWYDRVFADPNIMDRPDATEAFRQFEEIHPFRDGNGRVGALIFNLLNGTLAPEKLVFPPNLWKDPRRAGVRL